MALVFADFPSGQEGLYGTNTSYMLNGVWAQLFIGGSGSISLVEDPDPNVEGNVFRMGGSSGSARARIVNPAGAQATSGVGVRMWLSGLPTTTSIIPAIEFRNGSNVLICDAIVLPDGNLRVRNSAGATLGTTTVPAATANAWLHLEIKALRDAAAGTVELRVNGVSKLELTGLALGADNIAQAALSLSISGISDFIYWKDFIYWDGSGSEVNDFQGSVAVRDLLPDGDIALNWTTSSGSTGYNLLDESPPVDTGYIQAADPPPDPAKFSLTDLPDDVTSVRALIPIVRAVKTDGGDCNIQMGLTPNDTNWDDGADRPITTAFTYYWDVSHLSPATAAPWTPVEVNAAYVRVDRTL